MFFFADIMLFNICVYMYRYSRLLYVVCLQRPVSFVFDCLALVECEVLHVN